MVSIDAPIWLLLPLFLTFALAGGRKWRVRQRRGLPGDWAALADTDLHRFLQTLVRPASADRRFHLILAIATLLALALAGIGIGRGLPENGPGMAGRVILADLGEAQDPAPLRLAMAGLLSAGGETPTALVAIGARAFEVVPLTTDPAQIRRYAAVLDHEALPTPGRNLEQGFVQAIEMARRSGLRAVQVVLVSARAPPPPPALILPDEPRAMIVQSRALVVPEFRSAWEKTGDTAGLEVVGTGSTEVLQDHLLDALYRLARETDSGAGFGLAPFFTILAALSWLFLFRRSEA